MDVNGGEFDMTNGRVLAVNGMQLARLIVDAFNEAEESLKAEEANK